MPKGNGKNSIRNGRGTITEKQWGLGISGGMCAFFYFFSFLRGHFFLVPWIWATVKTSTGLPLQVPKAFKWVQLEDVTVLGIEKDNIVEPYGKFSKDLDRQIADIQDDKDGLKVFQQWPVACEHAMDCALKVQFQASPLPGMPQSLSQKHKGRCQMKMKELNPKCKSVPSDRFKLYEPPVEVFSAVAHAKVCQTRRLKS